MLNLKILLRVLQPGFIKKILFVFLAMSIVPIIDCYLIIQMAQLLGKYLFLAILVSLSLAGFFLSGVLVDKNLKKIDEKISNNILPLKDYNKFSGTLVVSFLFIIPGLISTLIALFISLPYFRIKLGSKISNYLQIDWKEIHEYINIID